MRRLVRRYALAGFRSEIQVRYHPPDGHEGDLEGFEQLVEDAVRRLGQRRAVIGFSITNEANLSISPNTSDGAYEGVVDALARGVIVARRELRRLGRGHLDVGFNVMWRWNPDSDRAFCRPLLGGGPAPRRVLAQARLRRLSAGDQAIRPKPARWRFESIRNRAGRAS